MNQESIIRHIRSYVATGIIDDALIEYYDQNGNWCGDTIQWQQGTPHALLAEMKKSFLPARRRTGRSRLGTVLRTSLVRHGDDHLQTAFAEIHGSLIVPGNAAIHAPNLRRINGNFISSTTRKVDMPWLTEVNGSLELLQTFLLRLPRLRRVGGHCLIAGMHPPLLAFVGGRLGLYWSFDFRANCLTQVGGSLVLSKAGDIEVPALRSVGGGILLSHLARRFVAPQLGSVGGDFLAGSVECMQMPRLQTVGGDFDSGSARGYYDPRIRVEGDWTVCPGAIREWELRDAARRALRCENFEI